MEHLRLYVFLKRGYKVFTLGKSNPSVSSDQMAMAVWEKVLLELVQDAFVLNIIERFCDIQKVHSCFELAAGFHCGLEA